MSQPKKNDWKGEFKKLEGRLGEIDNYRKSVDKVNFNIIRIEIIHAFIALAIVLVSIRQCSTTTLQNGLVENQNSLIYAQNKKIDIQSNLAEAQRRGSLVFLLSNVLDQINSELREDVGLPEKRDLSEQLIARIAALSNQFKPYRYLENDTLIETSLSPERGQLFYNITNSNIDDMTLIEIFRKCNFQYSDLRNSKINNAFIVNAILDYSDFSNASFENSVFVRSSCKNCNFKDSKIGFIYSDNKLKTKAGKGVFDSNFSGSDFSGSSMLNLLFKANYLKDCIFKEAFLNQCLITNHHQVGEISNNIIPNLNEAIVDYSFFEKHMHWNSLYGRENVLIQRAGRKPIDCYKLSLNNGVWDSQLVNNDE